VTETRTSLPAKLENLPLFMAAATEFARHAGFTEERIGSLELALEEVLVNVFKYAYPGGQGEATVVCRSENAGTLFIRIEDAGVPFNMLEAKAPDINAGIDDRPIGGLGIFLVRKLMDDVRYARQDGRNILTLIMLKNSSRTPAA